MSKIENSEFNRKFGQTSDPFILKDLQQMLDARKYNGWLYSMIAPFIGKRVLEVGPGIGSISVQIVPHVDLWVGIEPNPYCIEVLNERLVGNQNIRLIQAMAEDADEKVLQEYQFDTVVCVNVLEHIENDVSILKFFENSLQPGGRVVLLTPAMPQAYGTIDAAVGHFRRYTKQSMKQALEKAGLLPEKLFYFNFLGFWGWLFNARVRKLLQQDNSQIKTFDRLVPILSRLEKWIPPPVGMSLVAVSRKQEMFLKV